MYVHRSAPRRFRRLPEHTPVESYYKLVKKIEDDPEFDTKKAKKKLRRYVESHDHAARTGRATWPIPPFAAGQLTRHQAI